MKSFQKIQILALSLLVFALSMACSPVEPKNSPPGQPAGKVGPLLGCASGSPFAPKESLSLQVDIHELNGQFSAGVKSLNIQTVDQFKFYGPVQAKEFVKTLVDRELEKLGEDRTLSMKSRTFYNRFVARALLQVIRDEQPKGRWSFAQNEYVESGTQERIIKQTRLYLHIYDSALASSPNGNASDEVVHSPVIFCN